MGRDVKLGHWPAPSCWASHRGPWVDSRSIQLSRPPAAGEASAGEGGGCEVRARGAGLGAAHGGCQGGRAGRCQDGVGWGPDSGPRISE